MPEMTKQRPKHLALNEIRLPLAGFASILHRISGAGLFLMLPLLIWLLATVPRSTQANAPKCLPRSPGTGWSS
jgi:succinate dehydrogenase cytochrome b556 subunit